MPNHKELQPIYASIKTGKLYSKSRNDNLELTSDFRKDFEEICNAITNGDFNVLRSILERHSDEEWYYNVLFQICLNCKRSENFERAFWVLKEVADARRIRIDVNKKTKIGYGLLTVGIRFATNEVVLELLRMNGSLAELNDDGSYGLDEINSNVLEEHFNNCITGHDCYEDKLYFNYATLLKVSRESRELEPESMAIAFMCKRADKRRLITHPLIMYFILQKWYRIKWIYYVNLVFYLIFYASIILHLAVYHMAQCKTPGTWTILLTTTMLLVVREIIKLVVRRLSYISNIENCTSLMLALLLIYCGFSNLDRKSELELFAFVIIFATFGLLFIVGRHLRLIPNIIMLRAVSWTFFKFFAFYSILLLAFSISFSIVFNDPSVNPNGTFFYNPGVSLFKTIVMTTGEYELGSLNFEIFPIGSHLLILIFVVMVAIILINLMTGLAISDIQMIRCQAKLYAYIKTTWHIFLTELVVMNYYNRKVFAPLFRILNVNKRVRLFSHEDRKCRLRVNCNQKDVLGQKIIYKAMQLMKKHRNQKEEEAKSAQWKKLQEQNLEGLRNDVRVIRDMLESKCEQDSNLDLNSQGYPSDDTIKSDEYSLVP